MLTIEGLLGNLSFLQGTPAVLLAIITAVLILILRDWRGTLALLTVQYLLAGVLFASVLEPQMAGVKLVVGFFTCLILYFTGRQVEWGAVSVDINERFVQSGRPVTVGPVTLPADRLLRPALALVVGAAALLLLPRSADITLPGGLALTAYALIVLGLITLGVHVRPYRAGIGLLTFLTGFDLLYSALAFSNTLLIFFTAAHLATALVVTYLTHRRYFAEIKA
ncbi:MAG: hypothetical protein WAM60_17775 [Candidatus Promineifilaceae bacterium]